MLRHFYGAFGLFWSLISATNNAFHYIEKSCIDILQDFSFYIPLNKESNTGFEGHEVK